MIVPVEWLSEYVDLEGKNPEEIAETFTALGLMLDQPIMQSEFGNPVLDLEHRMDRADWLSILGCARDYAAMEELELKEPEKHTEKGKDPKRRNIVPIVVECPDLVSRFNTRVIKNVKVGESPDWLKKRLIEYGIPSINNIVDITNYVMVEYGQPLHAQDLAKFDKKEIVIRRAKKGETLKTLDGTVIELTPKMFVLTQNNEPIVLGGIVGGAKTAVTGETTDILLDAGNYNQANIRQTSRTLGIHNETVLRSEKFLHPELTQVAIERAVHLILKLAGGEYYENVDWYPNPQKPKTMELRYNRIEKLSGEGPAPKRVKDLLQKIDYRLIKESNEGLTLEIPYFRTDVLIEDDIVSDVLRLQNYDNIKVIVPPQAPPKEIISPETKIKEELRNILIKLGANEYVTNPLIPANLKNKRQVRLENALSEEQSALRTDIVQTLDAIAKKYQKQNKEGLIFELGRTYSKKRGKYKEKQQLAAIQIGEDYKETSIKIRRNLATLLKTLYIENFYFRESTKDIAKIMQGELQLGTLQQRNFTLNIQALLEAKRSKPNLVKEHRDTSSLELSVVLKEEQKLGKILHEAKNLDERIKTLNVLEEYKKGNKNSVLIKIELEAPVLESGTITEIQEKVILKLEEKGNIKILR